jgi:hypothetical protein
VNKNSDTKVPFTMEKIMKCVCPQCPVQGNSQCVKDKMEKLPEIMKNSSESKVPKSQEAPGVYCSTGIATCMGLDTKQMCICGGCPIFEEYNLAGRKSKFYYCRDGMAKTV